MELFIKLHTCHDNSLVYIKISNIIYLRENGDTYKCYELKKGEIPPYPGSGLYVERKGTFISLSNGDSLNVRESLTSLLKLLK